MIIDLDPCFHRHIEKTIFILIPDGIRVICAGLDNDPEKIGIHMLEMLVKYRNEGIVE